MAQLEYSLDAVNVLRKFYRCKVLVYVEGDDDLLFWKSVFCEFGYEDVAVECLGGSEEVEKYIVHIERDQANIVVARDADYSLVNGARSKNDRVIYSYGYSIENSLYTPKIIKHISLLCHRKIAPVEAGIAAWMDNFCEALKAVVINDIASQLGGLGVAALGSNCGRYMQSKNSPLTSPAKITARLDELRQKISTELYEKAEDLIHKAGGYDVRFLRGHLLASAVLRFVSSHAERNVSQETLYTNSVTLFEKYISQTHPHKSYYKEAVGRAMASFR